MKFIQMFYFTIFMIVSSNSYSETNKERNARIAEEKANDDFFRERDARIEKEKAEEERMTKPDMRACMNMAISIDDLKAAIKKHKVNLDSYDDADVRRYNSKVNQINEELDIYEPQCVNRWSDRSVSEFCKGTINNQFCNPKWGGASR